MTGLVRALQLAAVVAVAAVGVAWLDFRAFEVAVALVGTGAIGLALETLLPGERGAAPADDVLPDELLRWRQGLPR